MDNLPRSAAEQDHRAGRWNQRLAFVMDMRENGFHFCATRAQALDEARRTGHQVDVLFLDASDEDRCCAATFRRRAQAPAGDEGHRRRGIAKARAAQGPARQRHVIDTSQDERARAGKRQVQSRFDEPGATALAVTFMSFGFKYGVPSQADLVFRRALSAQPTSMPPSWKALTSGDEKVARFVLDRPRQPRFCRRPPTCSRS
ncbi:MAG: hypothetical protein IPJ65_03520 [Archangiaceae bacterium]|nr:hypothetical protein [Archangiaceae bacterium]